ncbi:hypothetical protein DXV76_20390 [Rhodobacteraceae bacterium CCMM004]|nr:hypothetical protein DXV76_20390 [Rhodobacteraceae bacterium CCMM004]
MTLARLRAWITRTPFRTPVTWTAGGTEDAAVHLWLELTGPDGVTGLSETPVKPAWTGLDGATALAAVEHLVAQRLLGRVPASAEAALADIRGLPVLRAAVGHALADLRAPGAAAAAQVAAVLTRADPAAMAEAAARAATDHGIHALKVKAGQGRDLDARALVLVREALGADGPMSVDANGAYDVEEGLALCRAAATVGAAFVEDPWPLAPDAATERALSAALCAVAVDRAAGDETTVPGLIDRGVAWIAVKPNRIGPDAARRIAATARAAGIGVVSGLFGEGPLGAVQQLRADTGDAPCEAVHHLTLRDPVPVAGLTLADGRLSAPPGRASDLVSVADVADRAVGGWEAAA